MSDQIEFYRDNQFVARVESSFAPDRGDKVNIQSVTYEVIGRSFTVDHACERHAQVSCVINLKATDEKPSL